jgi:hypothetical protein
MVACVVVANLLDIIQKSLWETTGFFIVQMREFGNARMREMGDLEKKNLISFKKVLMTAV